MTNKLTIITTFNNKNEPLITKIHNHKTTKTSTLKLYATNNKTTLYEVQQNKESIKKIIDKATKSDFEIVINDYKRHIKAFNIEPYKGFKEVYDINFYHTVSQNDIKYNDKLANTLLQKIITHTPKNWEKILAASSIAYQDIENRGILLSHMHVYPDISLNSYSGRSKSSKYNIHGYTEQDEIHNPIVGPNCTFIHFDWVAADFIIAGALSNDTELIESFNHNDPYDHIKKKLTTELGTIERDECKLLLLRAINSFDIESPIFQCAFEQLHSWLIDTKKSIEKDNHATSILGRKFSTKEDKDHKSVLNAILQGSVAQAMQVALKKVWDHFGRYVLFDIHDSIIVTIPKNQSLQEEVIDVVSSIMAHPFDGIINKKVFFPVRINIGENFKQWDEFKVIRNGQE